MVGPTVGLVVRGVGCRVGCWVDCWVGGGDCCVGHAVCVHAAGHAVGLAVGLAVGFDTVGDDEGDTVGCDVVGAAVIQSQVWPGSVQSPSEH